MASDPSSEQVQNFKEFTGATTDEAVKYLKGFPSSIDEAVMAFYEGRPLPPSRPAQEDPTTWNEAAWSGDRQGGYDGQPNLPSFQIESADGVGSYPHSTAPTRPPSRSADAWGGTMVPEWGITAESQIGPQQESGIIRENRAVWLSGDGGQWGATHVTNAEEVIPDVPARDRKREPGTVGFIKPLPSGEKFPALLTILATIPLTQEYLLLEPAVFREYGHDPQWWTGEEISISRVNYVDNEQSSDGQNQMYFEFIAETQRLMALLLSSHRLYGNPNLLANSTFLNSCLDEADVSTFPVIYRFLRGWQSLTNRYRENIGLSELDNMFKTTVSQRNNPEPEERTSDHWTVELRLSGWPSDHPQTLYDCLDDLIWEDANKGNSNRDFWITSPPPIFTLLVEQLDSSAKGLGMAVPLSWYADRYLKEHVKATRQMRRDAGAKLFEIQRLHEQLETITNCDYPDGKRGNAKKMYEIVIAGFEKRLASGSDGDDTQMPDSETIARTTRLMKRVQHLLSQIDAKAESLKQSLVAAEESLRDIRTIFTDPDSLDQEERPVVRYTLCGVATDAHTTYITNPASSHDQWTKIQYRTTPACEQEPVSQFDVLHAASSDSQSVLLVYALDSALEAKDIAIPDPLKAFIDTDNEYFSQELQAEHERDVSQELSGMGGMGMGADMGSHREGHSPDDGSNDSGLGMQLDPRYDDGMPLVPLERFSPTYW